MLCVKLATQISHAHHHTILFYITRILTYSLTNTVIQFRYYEQSEIQHILNIMILRLQYKKIEKWRQTALKGFW